MIYPRLNRVRNGQRLSVELVNGLIKRTEYAGDLLRQYKCVAGTDISVVQEYDGTTIQPITKTYTIPWNTRDDFLNGQLFPVSLTGTAFPPSAWSSLLTLYAVWISPGIGYPADAEIDYTFTYKISSSADNRASVYLDNVLILTSSSPQQITTTTMQIASGVHYIKTVARNDNNNQPLWIQNPAGWAVLIDYA